MINGFLIQLGLRALSMHGRAPLMLKCSEECGELSQAISKYLCTEAGMYSDKTMGELRQDIIDEMADVIITSLNIRLSMDITPRELEEAVHRKALRFEEKMDKVSGT
jgi:NTP pyrophosphatase (non-canonical NTP hydrolase)